MIKLFQQQTAFNKSFATLNMVNFSLLVDSIKSITTPGGDTVVDRAQITEFCNKTDANTINEKQINAQPINANTRDAKLINAKLKHA